MKKATIIDQESRQINFLDERYYLAGNDQEGNPIYYPSVTQVLNVYPKGAGFTQWLKDVGNSAAVIADRAAESGNKVHNGIEALLKGQQIDWTGENYDLEEWRGLNRFMEFYRTSELEVMGVELEVISHEFRYAGTVDLVCKINGETWMIDHKFGKSIYPSYFQQLVAYKRALEEMHEDLKIDKIGILHLKAQTRTVKQPTEKKPNDPWQGIGWQLVNPENDGATKKLAAKHEITPIEAIWNNWLRTLGIYYYENPVPMPKNETYPVSLSINPDQEGEVNEVFQPLLNFVSGPDQTLVDKLDKDLSK